MKTFTSLNISLLILTVFLLSSCATQPSGSQTNVSNATEVVLKTGELKVSSSSWINAEDLSLGVLPNYGEEGESDEGQEDDGLSSSENIVYDAFFDVEKQRKLIETIQEEINQSSSENTLARTIVIHFLRIEQLDSNQSVVYEFDTDISVFEDNKLVNTKQIVLNQKVTLGNTSSSINWEDVTTTVSERLKNALVKEIPLD